MAQDEAPRAPAASEEEQAPLVAVRRPKTQASTVETREIPLELIEEDPENARLTFAPEVIEARAKSLREVGQLQSAIVRRLEAGRFRLVDGALRFRAAPMAGLKTLRCDVYDLNDVQAALMATSANLQKENLTEYEQARAFDHVMKLAKAAGKPLSLTDVGRLANVAPNTVKNRLQLLKVPAEIGKRIGHNGFAIGHAHALAQLDGHPNLLQAALKAFDAAAELPQAGDANQFIIDALVKAGAIHDPHDGLSGAYGYAIDVEADTKKLPNVELVNRHGDKERFVTDKAALDAQRVQWQEQLKAHEAKNRKADPPASSKVKTTPLTSGEAVRAIAKSAEERRAAKEEAELEQRIEDIEAKLIAAGLAQKLLVASPRSRLAWRTIAKEIEAWSPRDSSQLETLLAIAKAQHIGTATDVVAKTFGPCFGEGLLELVPEDAPAWFEKLKPDAQLAFLLAVGNVGTFYSDYADATLIKAMTGQTSAQWKAQATEIAQAERDAKTKAGDSKGANKAKNAQWQKDHPHHCVWNPVEHRFKTRAELDDHDCPAKPGKAKGKAKAKGKGAAGAKARKPAKDQARLH